MASDSPPESTYQLWLHDCIMRYFRARDFNVRSLTVTQQDEKTLPFDIHYQVDKGNLVKRFGFQVKRAYKDGKGIFWRLDREQHSTLGGFSWILYALPTFVAYDMEEVSCHHILISRGNFSFRSRLRRGDLPIYYRWGGFAESFEECKVGETLSRSGRFIPTIHIIEELQLTNNIMVETDFTDRLVNIVRTPATRDGGQE